jgi:hypothetical protein
MYVVNVFGSQDLERQSFDYHSTALEEPMEVLFANSRSEDEQVATLNMKKLKQTEEPSTNSAPAAQLRVYDNGTASKF